MVHEATIDMGKIRKAIEFMTRKMKCPVYGTERYFYRFCNEIQFHTDNLSRLAQALEDPNRPSYPKRLRKLRRNDIHSRTDKNLAVPELQNWIDSGYNYGSIIWDKFKTMCSKDDLSCTMDNFAHKIRQYVVEKRGDTYNRPIDGDLQTNWENVEITVTNIIDFSIAMKWFDGTESSVNTGNSSVADDTWGDNREYILFHCCEELELLAREYSNDEGGNNSVATGPQVDTGTEHPDYLIQQGLAQTMLHRMPLAQPCWENPIPEHTPGLLQKAFPFIFKTGDGDPYQERPRSVMTPKTTWLGNYFGWVANLPGAQRCPELQFYIHNRAIRIAGLENAQVAVRHSGIDLENLPTREEILHDKDKRAELEGKILCMTSNVRDSDAFWQKQCQDLIGSTRYFENPPKYRERVPQNIIFFQTRALPYNSHPAIHSLFPNFEAVSKLPDAEYMKARFSNTLEYPQIPQWLGAFMA